MAIGDIYKLHVRLRVTGGSLTAENSFAFRQDGVAIFATPEEDLVAFWENEVQGTYNDTYHGNYGVVQLAVEQLPAGLIAFTKTEPDLSGTLTGDQLAPQVAGLMHINTGHLGRRGKGRIFFPPANEGSNGGSGTVSTGYVNNMEAVGAILLAGSGVIAYAGWVWGVWSESDQAFYEATSYAGQFRWGTQRGRAR